MNAIQQIRGQGCLYKLYNSYYMLSFDYFDGEVFNTIEV